MSTIQGTGALRCCGCSHARSLRTEAATEPVPPSRLRHESHGGSALRTHAADGRTASRAWHPDRQAARRVIQLGDALTNRMDARHRDGSQLSPIADFARPASRRLSTGPAAVNRQEETHARNARTPARTGFVIVFAAMWTWRRSARRAYNRANPARRRRNLLLSALNFMLAAQLLRRCSPHRTSFTQARWGLRRWSRYHPGAPSRPASCCSTAPTNGATA